MRSSPIQRRPAPAADVPRIRTSVNYANESVNKPGDECERFEVYKYNARERLPNSDITCVDPTALELQKQYVADMPRAAPCTRIPSLWSAKTTDVGSKTACALGSDCAGQFPAPDS
jgi:hypothetical protein